MRFIFSYVSSVPISDDPDAMIAGIEDDVRRVRDRAERMGELAAASESVRGSAASQGRDLVVEVEASGRVTKLQISNQALSRGGTRIGSDLMDLLGQAHQDAQAQVLHAAIGALGDDDPLLAMLRPDASENHGAVALESRGLGLSGVAGLGVVPRKSGGLW